MGFGTGLVRTLMFVFNGIFFLLGLALAVMGGLVVGSKYIKAFNEALPAGDDYSQLTYAGGAVLAFGVVVMIVSFLGCCGAAKHNKCMLYSFAGVMGVFVIAQVVVGILAFVYRGDVEDTVRELAFKGLEQTNGTDASILTGWNELQELLRCCGVNGSSDWKETQGTPFYGTTTRPFWPDSCCQELSTTCATSPDSKPFAAGCYSAVYDELEPYGLMIGLGAIIFALLQMLGIVFACCLGQSAD